MTGLTRAIIEDTTLGVVESYGDDEAIGGAIMDDRAQTAIEPMPNEDDAPHPRRGLIPQRQPRQPAISRSKINPADPRVRLIQNQCLKMSLALFDRTQRHTRSLGFSSAIPGEGRTFLATVTATALAERSHRSVTLIDCNWDHPTVHAQFGIPNAPGLAEWLRHECDLADIRHTVSPYLTIIPSGDGLGDSLALADRFRAVGAKAVLAAPDELLVVDLPAVLTTDYGTLLPQALDAVLFVVRAGATQEAYIAEAYRELSEVAVEGTILNGAHSSIPRWLLRLL